MDVFRIYMLVLLGASSIRALEQTIFNLTSASGTLNNEESGGGYLADHHYIWKMPNEKYEGRILFVKIVEMKLKLPRDGRPDVKECAADLVLGDLAPLCNRPATNCRLYGYKPYVHEFKTNLSSIDHTDCTAWFLEDKYLEQVKLRVFKDDSKRLPYIRHGLRILINYHYIPKTKEEEPTIRPKEKQPTIKNETITASKCEPNVTSSSNYVAAIVILVLLLCFVSGILLWEVYKQRTLNNTRFATPPHTTAVVHPGISTHEVTVGPYASIGETTDRQNTAGSVNPTYSEIGQSQSGNDSYYQIPTNRYAIQEDDSVNDEEPPTPEPPTTSGAVYAMVNKNRI